VIGELLLVDELGVPPGGGSGGAGNESGNVSRGHWKCGLSLLPSLKELRVSSAVGDVVELVLLPLELLLVPLGLSDGATAESSHRGSAGSWEAPLLPSPESVQVDLVGLALVSDLLGPPLLGGGRAWNEAGNVARGHWTGGLSLLPSPESVEVDLVGLALVSDLLGPPLGGSGRAWNEAGNVSRGHWTGGLSLLPSPKSVEVDLVGLALVSDLSSPPLGGGGRAWNEAGNVARGHWNCGLWAPLPSCESVELCLLPLELLLVPLGLSNGATAESSHRGSAGDGETPLPSARCHITAVRDEVEILLLSLKLGLVPSFWNSLPTDEGGHGKKEQ